MDKHYGWQEDRGSQSSQGRMQNGHRWNERSRDDERDMRSGRGGDGWDDENRRWTSGGGNIDREDYTSDRDDFGGRGRGGYSQGGQRFGGQSYGSNQGFGNQGYGGNQGFSGGHYGGYANEGYPGQGNYGGNRGFSNQGYSGQRNQGWSGQDREFSGQGSWNQGSWNQGSSNQGGGGQGGQSWGQTFGQGYAGSDYESQRGGYGGGGQASGGGSQYYGGGQGYGQSWRGSRAGGSMGRGFFGRGPKGYQRSDDRVKEQLSDRLMDDDDIDASEITIEVKNGEVTLTGTVNSREEKRHAEAIAEQSPGVREVQNHLRVSHENASDSSTPSGQSGRSASAGTAGTTGTSKPRGGERE